jgi:CRISPR-associated protein Cas1
MNDKDPFTSSQNRFSEQELALGLRNGPPDRLEKSPSPLDSRGTAPGTKDRKTVRIVVRVSPTPSPQVELPPPVAEISAPIVPVPLPEPGEIKTRAEPEPQHIPARMLNEFVYCKRLFYYEFVEGVFMDNADTLRGNAIHKKVDSVENGLPSAKSGTAGATLDVPVSGVDAKLQDGDTIHSRSVQMGSERLKVIAKMDLVESKLDQEDLFSTLTVCPVDYKAGSPRETKKGNELWDTDKIQLGLQALILRDNGYICNEGIIYYRETRQRVRLEITPDLESWVRKQIGEARETAKGSIPPPLVDSPKCVRCSLAPVCMPDETGFLARSKAEPETGNLGHGSGQVGLANSRLIDKPVRRLIASRDETRPLYLNTPGLRVGCSGEVLTVKEKDKVIEEVRMRDVSHVGLFGNIQISTQAIQTLCEEEILFFNGRMVLWNHARA